MSSPVVSGAVILMYEQYNEFYSTDPLPSTIRAVLYHTAIDYGNDGPDYQYGYGRIHVKDAIDLIIDDNGQNLKIVEDQLYNSQTDQFQVYVEPGQTELKITVAWDDKAAYGGSGVKLLNNLNLLLISPSSSNYYPWTLDWNSPSSPATTGIDTRNNMEQVYVSNPESGVWTVQVTGSYIPYAPQQYSLIGDFTENTGTIGGNVTDAVTADPIEGALVRALHTAVSDITNSNGSYTLAGLEAGVYDISFSHDNYESLTENDIEVIVGETTRLYVEMTPISGCDFVPGDISGDGNVIGGDVTYGVQYLLGGPPPPDSCWLASNSSWLYSAADVTGDCIFIGGDISYLVSYFIGSGNSPQWCPETPPPAPALLEGENEFIIPSEFEGNR